MSHDPKDPDPRDVARSQINISTATEDTALLEALAARLNEPREERRARLEQAAAAAEHKRKLDEEKDKHERWKERWTLVAGTVIVFVIGAFCLWVIYEDKFTEKTWATSLLTSMITGIIGYMTGKSSR